MRKNSWIFKTDDIINSRYVVVQELAHGGTSEVFKVRDRYDNQQYALKVMEANPSLKHFFNKETSILANLSFSGNVVTIKDLGIVRNLDNEYAFIVLDLYENGTIDNIPTDGKYSIMSSREITYYFKKILKALESIHCNGKYPMVHKDVKPQNILINLEREPFISDFGISLIQDPEGKHNLNDGLGTPKYMAPELAVPIVNVKNDGPGYFVDIYAIGIMLYKYTTGIWPYEDFQVKDEKPNPKKLELQKAQRILNLNIWMDLVRPSVYNPAISLHLENIILKCLAKDYKKRYQTVNELIADLNSWTDTSDGKYAKQFLNYNEKPKHLPKQYDMYPTRFNKFFKNFNAFWFILIGSIIVVLCFIFVMTLFLS